MKASKSAGTRSQWELQQLGTLLLHQHTQLLRSGDLSHLVPPAPHPLSKQHLIIITFPGKNKTVLKVGVGAKE